MNADPINEFESHGICSECSISFPMAIGVGLRQFLSTTEVPVLAMNGETDVLAANPAALSVLEKTSDVIGQVSGVVIECSRSASGECGGHIECSGCNLRSTIQATHVDGVPRNGVISTHPLSGEAGKTLRLTFSTAKVRDVVLLTIRQREITSASE
jgi:hypothetical protein